jgi:hypothetical protein
LVGWSDEWGDSAVLQAGSVGSEVGPQEIKRKREAEIEALESMSGANFRKISENLLDIKIPEASQPISLHLHLPTPTPQRPTVYPSPTEPGTPPILPVFYVHSAAGSVPAYIRLHLTALLLHRIRDPERTDWLEILEMGEGGLIYEMVAFLGEVIQGVLRSPPPSSEVLRNLKGNTDAEYSGRSANNSGTNTPVRRNGRSGFFKATGDGPSLLKDHEKLVATPAYRDMLEKRQRLPAWKAREELVQTIKDNRVVIVSGATGSGKTTQVPAYVLEDAILAGNGGKMDMICTQPRRISAIGVASRVAQERTEKVGEGLVGYAIRGERKASRACRLLFCTTGICERSSSCHTRLVAHEYRYFLQCYKGYLEEEIPTWRAFRTSSLTKCMSEL